MVAIWDRLSTRDKTARPLPVEPAAREDDRRNAIRYPCNNVKTTIQPIALAETIAIPVRVRDISTGGLGLLCQLPIPPGMFFVINLQNTVGGQARTLRARVVRSTRLDSKTWVLGCSFVNALTREQVQALL